MLTEIHFLTLIIGGGFRDKQFSRWDFSFSVITSGRWHRSNCKMAIKTYFHSLFAVDCDDDDDGDLGIELDMKHL